MYPFGRPIDEEEQPFSTPRPNSYDPVWSSWSPSAKIVFVIILVLSLIFVLVMFILECKHSSEQVTNVSLPFSSPHKKNTGKVY